MGQQPEPPRESLPPCRHNVGAAIAGGNMGRNIGHRIRYSSLILAVVALGLTLVVTWAGRTTGASSIALADNNNATAIYACVKANKFFHVSIGKPTTCPNGSAGVQWQGIVSPVAPSTAPATGSSSSASATSPAGASSSPASPPSSSAPATSSAAPSSTVTSTPSGAPCVTSELSGTCGPYDDVGISNASGYNTYVGNNMWACGSVQPGKPGADCGVQTVSAHDPGNWNVVSDQAAGNTGVLTYPDIQQVF